MPIQNATQSPVRTPKAKHSHNPFAVIGRAIEKGAIKLKDTFQDTIEEAVGATELLGIRYPVHHYKEPVSATVTRGSRLEKESDYADLAAAGYTATVDLTLEGTKDAQLAPKYGLQTLNIPILDNGHPTFDQMKEFLDFVTAPEIVGNGGKVYVHCEAGIGRTGIAVACYRMAVEGKSVGEALADANAHGLKTPNQIQFIKDFSKALKAGKIEGYGAAAPTVLAAG